jgi:predicted nicotinamide N-methyase
MSKSPTKKRKRAPAVPVLLHDAPMANHLSVGVQTWGSAILLGRRMAKYPDQFGLFNSYGSEGIRILELGAGTGLLSILCRKLLDLKAATDSHSSPRTPNHREHEEGKGKGLIVATDFLPEVIDNLKTCVNLNFPSSETGIEIAKLDWTTFPNYMASRSAGDRQEKEEEGEETSQFMDKPFDLVLASDCVYDETHARMLREVVSWTLRLPEDGDEGGTFVCLFLPSFFFLFFLLRSSFPIIYPCFPLSFSKDTFS